MSKRGTLTQLEMGAWASAFGAAFVADAERMALHFSSSMGAVLDRPDILGQATEVAIGMADRAVTALRVVAPEAEFTSEYVDLEVK